ncbi:MAG: hypothetical protein JWN98_244, partial [Abditibacteriota bacterium]|nr:hypothetical protein [Abditibacteriota bacterium]
MAFTDLFVTTRQRNIELIANRSTLAAFTPRQFVDAEAFAHAIDATEFSQQVAQRFGFETKDFEIGIFGLQSQQFIAHVAADQKSATSAFLDGAGNGVRFGKKRVGGSEVSIGEGHHSQV